MIPPKKDFPDRRGQTLFIDARSLGVMLNRTLRDLTPDEFSEAIEEGADVPPLALDGPALPKAVTRFRLPWRWDGGPAVLQSRAIDETGAVQPSRPALMA